MLFVIDEVGLWRRARRWSSRGRRARAVRRRGRPRTWGAGHRDRRRARAARARPRLRRRRDDQPGRPPGVGRPGRPGPGADRWRRGRHGPRGDRRTSVVRRGDRSRPGRRAHRVGREPQRRGNGDHDARDRDPEERPRSTVSCATTRGTSTRPSRSSRDASTCTRSRRSPTAPTRSTRSPTRSRPARAARSRGSPSSPEHPRRRDPPWTSRPSSSSTASGGTPPTAPPSTSIDPATGELVAKVADATEDDVRAMIDARRGGAGRRGPRCPALERAEIMRRAARIFEERIDELARLLTREQGKPLDQAVGELQYGIGFIDWFAEEAPPRPRHDHPGRRPDEADRHASSSRSASPPASPRGTSPSLQILRKLGAGLAAGCTHDRQAGRTHAAVGARDRSVLRRRRACRPECCRSRVQRRPKGQRRRSWPTSGSAPSRSPGRPRSARS